MSKVKPACEEMRVLMMGLMDNELDASQKKKVLEHLVSCEECA
ncbi:MAG TPA: zf-HC2 domain-containing protein, partial [Caldithrix sp.]|nr:zf-HC2 domain-containing protein [Caldithrix sp.]